MPALDVLQVLRRATVGQTGLWNSTDVSQGDVPFTYQTGVEWHIFSSGELVAASITAFTGLLSLLSITILTIYTLYSTQIIPFVRQRLPFASPPPSQYSHHTTSSLNIKESFLPFEQFRSSSQHRFWVSTIGILLVQLLISDFIQSLAGTIQVHWVSQGRITDNNLCKLQGATLLLGDVASAIWSALIALSTFGHVVLGLNLDGKRGRTWVLSVIVIGGWSTAIVLNLLGPLVLQKAGPGNEWYGIAGPWCFVTSSHLLPRIFLHYVPLFLAAFVILVSYVGTFLCLRGFLSFSHRRFHFTFHPSKAVTEEAGHVREISGKMLWYPLVYIVLILPDSSARLAALSGKTAPDWFWFTGIAAMFCMGFANVVIYCSTRSVLGSSSATYDYPATPTPTPHSAAYTTSSFASPGSPRPSLPASTPRSGTNRFPGSPSPFGFHHNRGSAGSFGSTRGLLTPIPEAAHLPMRALAGPGNSPTTPGSDFGMMSDCPTPTSANARPTPERRAKVFQHPFVGSEMGEEDGEPLPSPPSTILSAASSPKPNSPSNYSQSSYSHSNLPPMPPTPRTPLPPIPRAKSPSPKKRQSRSRSRATMKSISHSIARSLSLNRGSIYPRSVRSIDGMDDIEEMPGSPTLGFEREGFIPIHF